MGIERRDSAEDLWKSPPDDLPLEQRQVHVWRANLNQAPATFQRLWSLLALDESQRARRYYFQRDREHFVVGRGLLRTILGLYLGLSPEKLRFCYSAYDKPTLAPEFGGSALSFNLSHSHSLALLAVTLDRQIGVDVEYMQPNVLDDRIAERYFSPSEAQTLYSLPKEEQLGAFFACWTRKEAFIKAVGEGLSIPLDQFEVSLKPGEPAALVHTWNDPAEAARWTMCDLHPGNNFKGALCAEGHDLAIRCWQWPDG